MRVDMPVAIGFRVWTIALCSFDLFEQRCVETNEHMQLDSAAHGIGLLPFCCHSRLTSYAAVHCGSIGLCVCLHGHAPFMIEKL